MHTLAAATHGRPVSVLHLPSPVVLGVLGGCSGSAPRLLTCRTALTKYAHCFLCCHLCPQALFQGLNPEAVAYLHIHVRRTHVVEDALNQVAKRTRANCNALILSALAWVQRGVALTAAVLHAN